MLTYNAANYNSTLLCDYGELTANYKKLETTNAALTQELSRFKQEFHRVRQESSLKDTENARLRMHIRQLRTSHEQQLLENKRIKDNLDALRNAAPSISQPAAKRRRLNSSANRL
mmetsp:Transcript_26692/g.43686  ORF Transcript_26692/g.43686 Transcript_26692/m.43686 type:complete len:115 (+) Transcript_26692:1349-1693(+)